MIATQDQTGLSSNSARPKCLSKEGPKLLISEQEWVDIAFGCCTCIAPFGGASRQMGSVLQWTADNGNALVRAVATELAPFPEADEALWQAIAFKKWRFAPTETAVERRMNAIHGFIERNQRAATLPMPDRYTRERMRMLLARWLPYQGVACPRFGPGAVAERYSHARRWQVLNDWLSSQESEHSASVEGRINGPRMWKDGLSYDADDCVLSKHTTARLVAVPKDWNKDRLITVEPAFNAFLQQSARLSILESVHSGPLRGSAMDLYVDGQAIQRRLALRGSADGSCATLDLSDASDNITAELVFDVFPFWVTTLLEQCRTTHFSDGSVTRPLYIYAGMGNATTFIVETLLFTAYCHAIAWRHGRHYPLVSVFGDDIITDQPLASILCGTSDEFFRINENKSFVGQHTKLRESCGIYALSGSDVTPTRINGFADNFAGRLGASELVRRLEKSSRAYQVRLWASLAENLAGKMPNWPFHVESYPSVVVPWVPYTALPPTRRHATLQCRQARLSVPSPQKCEARVTKDCRWALQGSLAGVLRTSKRIKGDVVSFPIRDAWTKPRFRWLNITD